MKKPGRESAASLGVVSITAAIKRPAPPAELTSEQAEEWCAITDKMPASWFGRETHGLLAQLCRHRVTARRVAQIVSMIETDEEFDMNGYDKALSMQDRESRCIAALSRALRLTPQSRIDPAAAGRKTRTHDGDKKPWEI